MPRMTLPPNQMRIIREGLGLSREQLASLLETTRWIVERWERPVDRKSYTPPPSRCVRLLKAYEAGYRPDDWPEDVL